MEFLRSEVHKLSIPITIKTVYIVKLITKILYFVGMYTN